MKARIYKHRCNGCTICNITCPEVFAIGEDGKAAVRSESVPSVFQEVCQEAADECPSNAIVLDEAPVVYGAHAVMLAGVK